VALAAGFGLGIWAYGENESNFPRRMAVLALPFFCWFPLTLSLLLWVLWLFWQWYSILAVASLVAFCAFLWWWGQERDRRSRNPFHGILDKVEGIKKPSQ
jgi:uncharacterized membrane protein YqjE